MLTLKFAFLHSWQKKILSRMVMASIFFKNQSQPSCLKFKFPAKNYQPIRKQEDKPAGITCNRQDPMSFSAPKKTCQHWKLTTKLDPCGGGKGGPISKLWATLNKVVFRRLSKLYLFPYDYKKLTKIIFLDLPWM